MAQYRNKKTIAWIALVVAVTALIISWLALNNSAGSQDIEELIDQRVGEAVLELEAELEALQTDSETNDTSAETENTGTTTTDFSAN